MDHFADRIQKIGQTCPFCREECVLLHDPVTLKTLIWCVRGHVGTFTPDDGAYSRFSF